MIPKKIHYCWFGGNPLPELAKKCIDSWKLFLPDYEIKEWNESNFDLELYPFAQQAYQTKKYAFVADVVRLYALREEGGIYMDTDVEVLKPLDRFLEHAAFSGFESGEYVPTGIIGSEKSGKWVTKMLSYYDNASFLDSNNNPILETNVSIITRQMKEDGFIMNNTFQEIDGYIAFYPRDFFCPKDWDGDIIGITQNTHCIHHFAGSWLPKKKPKSKFRLFFKNIFSFR